jgi:dihydroxyacetone kinase
MLSAAVCGSIFASPNVGQVQRGIELIDAQSSDGVLVIVKNYTGDVLNFGLAVEQQRAKLVAQGKQGNRICMLIVGDDVAVGRKQGAIVGRR